MLHDWGGGLGFDWANQHRDAVRAIAFTETICGPVSLDDWPDGGRDLFAAMRSEAGEEIILTKNIFVITMIGAVAFCAACLVVLS